MGLDTCEKLIVENTVFTHVENPGELVLSSGYDAERWREGVRGRQQLSGSLGYTSCCITLERMLWGDLPFNLEIFQF